MEGKAETEAGASAVSAAAPPSTAGTAAAATPGRLRAPSKIAPVTIKKFDFAALNAAASATAASAKSDEQTVETQSEEPQPTAEDFKVHTTSLKRKPEGPAAGTATQRNTRARLDAAGTSKPGAKPVTAKSTAAKTTTARTGTAKSTAPARSAASARSTAASRATTTRTGIAGSRTTATRATATASKAPSKAPTPENESTDAAAPKKKKRPAWDVKGRLEDLEEYNHQTESRLQDSKQQLAQMTDELQQSRMTINELMAFRQSLESKVEVKEKENVTISKDLSELRNELQSAKSRHEEEVATLKSRHGREMEDIKANVKRLENARDDLTTELRLAKDENIQLRSTIATQSAASLTIESECRATKLKLEQTEETVRQRNDRVAELEKQLEEANKTVAELEGKVREEETLRRRLHNTIQELKGNIRVFCRVRPPLGQEAKDKKPEEIMSHIAFSDNDEKAIELTQSVDNASGSKTVAKSYPFSFDRVFQPKAKQAEVFEEISQLVQSALDGYNVCIFAYGQTGSGKTYTMEGPDNFDEHPDEMGMIPRTVQQIFATAESLKEKGWTYTMEGQFLEIYNETIRDLLGSGTDDKKHDIKHNATTGKTTVTDAVTVMVSSPSEVAKLLKKASHNRAVAATNCNERSSRSHSVFTLRLNGHNSLTDESSEGILNLIDLAGSERLSASGSTGDRLKETQAINKSLSCLGDVIYSLANKDSHVPYRNSKLTYLLQGSLGGNSKTLMFVNVSPLSTNFQETLCSLRFATKVNACQIGTARKVIK
ncbi:kinesin-like nuclear fusion protein [Borealophlyctis nickersoniae]|nr:kinesin-like nuclear fusion protein [Borealophlyctis nickersoniae]